MLYPVAVGLSVVYLGHHYVVDLIGGIIYASIGYWIVCGPVGEYVVRRANEAATRRTRAPELPVAKEAELALRR